MLKVQEKQLISSQEKLENIMNQGDNEKVSELEKLLSDVTTERNEANTKIKNAQE